MHVCIIIDNVSAKDVQVCLRKKGPLFKHFCWDAQKFAESVAVAISSTGITRYDREYKSGVYTFRMKQWDEEALYKILPDYPAGAKLRGWEIDWKRREHLAKALWTHPKLGALATNEIASHVVPCVIQDYFDKYGISGLSPQ